MNKLWSYMLGVATLLLVAVVTIQTGQKAPERAPQPPPASQSPQWVLALNIVTNQHATAYTEAAGASPSSSGTPYFPGSVAVHPRTPGGNPLEPIIPFGTTVKLIRPDSITIQNREFNQFQVIDTGDVRWSLRGESPYWLDIYFGTTNQWSQREASWYGVKQVDYFWLHVVDDKGTVPVQE